MLVTRPQPQANEWVARLHALGLRAVALPLLSIAAAADPAPVRAAWAGLAGTAAGLVPARPPAHPPAHPRAHPPAVVMFVSPSAVDRFFALKPAALVWPPGVIAAGTGPGTRRALLAAGVPGAAVLSPPDDGGQFESGGVQGVPPGAGKAVLWRMDRLPLLLIRVVSDIEGESR